MLTKRVVRLCGAIGVCVCALTLGAPVANADFDTAIQITADNGEYSATANIGFKQGMWHIDPGAPGEHRAMAWSYTLRGNGITLQTPSGDDLAYITGLHADFGGDPEVNLNFSVQAGSSATTFHIASSLLSFPTISSPTGLANASYTLTDFNFDGASLTGVGETGGGYLAQYNGWAGHPAGPMGTTFAEGIFTMSTFGGVVTQNYEYPAGGGQTAIGVPVSNMSSLISFQLSSNDLASGTSHFEIVPEPAAVALLVLGGVVFGRRR